MADYATLPLDHLTLICRSVERIFLQAYVPILRSAGGVCPVPALAEGVRDSAVGSVRQVRRRLRRQGVLVGHGVPVRRFAKGENKEQIARAGGDGRVVLLGVAQEETRIGRSWKATGQEHVAHPHMEWARQMGFVNHFYFLPCGTRTGVGRFGRPSPTPVTGVSG